MYFNKEAVNLYFESLAHEGPGSTPAQQGYNPPHQQHTQPGQGHFPPNHGQDEDLTQEEINAMTRNEACMFKS